MTILYIGGFELPDKNAAAQRVLGIAKGLRDLGHEVVFLNAINSNPSLNKTEKKYYGFRTIEIQKIQNFDYLFSGKSTIDIINEIRPAAVLAYNYPAVSLNTIRKHCNSYDIMCFADVTEWYRAVGGSIVYKLVKTFDTEYRMRFVHKKLDGVIVISRYLYNYYKDILNTVLIPPTVDITDDKWKVEINHDNKATSLIYAGVPYSLKERLDTVIDAVSNVSNGFDLVLNVVGVSKEEFVNLYHWQRPIKDSIVFWGKKEHTEVVRMVKNSDWAIIIRENNRVVKAGFPTKLVEAITCNTPVIANEFSNIEDYLDENNSIIVSDYSQIEDAIRKAVSKKAIVDHSIFDYHNYTIQLKRLF